MLDSQAKKSEFFKFRLSKSEKAALKDKALQANLSLGSYLIQTGLQKTIPNSSVNRSVYSDLGRVQQDIKLTIYKLDHSNELEVSNIQHSLQVLGNRLEQIQQQLINFR